MSAEDFQLTDKTLLIIRLEKNEFMKIYHQQRVNVNDSGKSVDFIFGEISNFCQIGNA